MGWSAQRPRRCPVVTSGGRGGVWRRKIESNEDVERRAHEEIHEVLRLAVFACRCWRRGAPAAPSSPASPQDDDINRPLISDNLDDYSGPSNYLCSSIVGESGIRINRSDTSPRTHGLVNKGIIYPTESHLIEEIHLGSTLKRTAEASGPTTDVKHIRRDSREENHNGSLPVKDTTVGSHLALEVIAGPSHGINRYLQSGNTSMLRMTLGRVPPSDLVLNDSEVSGKHARIDWNANDNPWEKDINQGTLVVFNVDPSITNDDLHQIFGDYGEIGRFRILLKWVITKLCSGAGGGVRRLNGRVHGATGGGGRRSKGRRPLPCRSVVAENGQRVGDGSRYQFELPKDCIWSWRFDDTFRKGYDLIYFEMSFRDALKEVLSANMFSSRRNRMQAEIVTGGQVQ